MSQIIKIQIGRLIRGFERSETDNLASFGYELKKTGFSFGTSYEQYKIFFFTFIQTIMMN